MSALLHGLKQQIPRAVLLLLASLVGMILFQLGSLLPPHALNQLDKLIMLKVILIAILLIGCLLTWVYYLKLAINDNVNMFDYEQPQELGGVSKHNKTGKLFCTSCLTNKLLSPVKTNKHNWRCLYKPCIKNYDNPENPAPKKTNPPRAMRFNYDRDLW